MATKAYTVSNAEIPVIIGDKKFIFEPFEFMVATSTFWGVYDTSDETEQKLLEGIKTVDALSEEDRAKVLQKKSNTPSRLNLIVSHEPQPLQFNREQVADHAGKADPAAVLKTKVEAQDDILATKILNKKR